MADEGIPLSYVSIQNIAKSAGVELGPSGGRSREARAGAVARRQAVARVAAVEVDDDPEDPEERLEADQRLVDATIDRPPRPMPPLADDAPPEEVAVWERLREVRAITDALAPRVRADEYAPTQWATLVKLEAQVAVELGKMRPPPPPDPARDPTNIAAREMTHSTTVVAIDAAWQRLLEEMKDAVYIDGVKCPPERVEFRIGPRAA